MGHFYLVCIILGRMEEDESVLRGDKGREEETFWLSSNKLNCFKKLVLLIIVTLKILYIYYLR